MPALQTLKEQLQTLQKFYKKPHPSFKPAIDQKSFEEIVAFINYPGCRLCYNSHILSEGRSRVQPVKCGYCMRMRMIINEIVAGNTTIQVRSRDRDLPTDPGRPRGRRPKQFSRRPKEFC